jgi:tetratricopeptide (TPR) repeat protein
MRGMLASVLVACAVAAAPARAATVPELYQQSYDQEMFRDAAGALSTLERVPQAEQQTYVFALRRAWLLYLSARYADAVTQYEEAVTRAPKAAEPLLGLSLVQMALRRWVDAEKTLQALLALDPSSYLGLSRLAWTQYSLGRYSAAEATYRRVLALYPSDVEMQAGLGWALSKQDKGAAAKQAFEAVLRVAPRHVSAQDGLRGLSGT